MKILKTWQIYIYIFLFENNDYFGNIMHVYIETLNSIRNRMCFNPMLIKFDFITSILNVQNL